jgi:iron complex transport system substrate-binding protein
VNGVCAVALLLCSSVIMAQSANHQRILSLGGSLTEIVYALGAEQQLIAVDLTSVYPAEALQELPSVGYIRSLSAEPILSMNPDLIMATSDAGPPQVLDQLREAGVQVEVIDDEPTVEGILRKIERVAALVGEPAKGAAMINKLREDYARAQQIVAQAESSPGVMFLLSVGSGAPTASGVDTSAHNMITMAGGRNVLSSMRGYKAVSPEAVLLGAPEYIIVMRRIVNEMGSEEAILSIPEIAATPAAAKGNLLVFDGLYFTGFGPRTVSAILDLASRLHPELDREGPRAVSAR